MESMSAQSIDKLRQFPLFRGCGPDELERLDACVSPRSMPTAGEVLFGQGVDSDAAYIVKSGLLIAELVLDDGQSVEMARMGAGAIVGELCLIKGGPRSLRVRCSEPTQLLRIDRDRFELLRSNNDSAAYAVIRNICYTMCDRLRTTNEFIESELRHEAPMQAAEARAKKAGVVERARTYLSSLFGKGS